MTTIVIKESELSPFFDSGQRKILRDLAQLIANQIDTTINNLALDDLTDVTAPSPVTGDKLEFQSTEWVNEDPFTGVVTVADTAYTALLTNADSFIKFTAATAVTYTIPPQSDVAWRDSTQIEFMQYGAGKVTVAGGSGVTIRVEALLSTTTVGQYAVAGLKRIAEDEWVLFGHLEA